MKEEDVNEKEGKERPTEEGENGKDIMCGQCHNYWRDRKDLIRSIAVSTGTPVYIYSEALINERLNCVSEKMSGSGSINDGYSIKIKIYYCLISNANHSIVRSMLSAGVNGVVVSSRGEYFIAQKAGIKQNEIIISFAGLTADDLFFFNTFFQFPKNDKYPIIIINSLKQAEIISENNKMYPWLKNVNFGIRVKLDDSNLPDELDDDSFKYYLGSQARMGITEDKIDEVIDIFNKMNLGNRIKGICSNLGTYITSEKQQSYFAILRRLFEFSLKKSKKHELSLEFINIGGGFGLPYDSGYDSSNDIKKEEFCFSALGEKLREFRDDVDLKELFRKPQGSEPGSEFEIFIEPGRYIIAPAGILVTKIIEKKDEIAKVKKDGETIKMNIHFIVSDASSSIFPRTYICGNKTNHKIVLIPGGTHISRGDSFANGCRIHIVGCSKAARDFIRENMQGCDMECLDEKETKVDDILLIMDAGADGYAMSSNYGGMLRPSEALIQKDDSVYEIREKEEAADLIKKIPVIPKLLITR